MRLLLLLALLPFLRVFATPPSCAGQNKGWRIGMLTNPPRYSWSKKQWADLWQARADVCTNSWKTSGRSTRTDAWALSDLGVGHCSQQSCWNNMEAIIWNCLDSDKGRLATEGVVYDYGGGCVYTIGFSKQPTP